MNKRKTKKIKRKGGASLRSPQSKSIQSSPQRSPQSSPTISEAEKLKLLKRDKLFDPIGDIKRKLDKLKEDSNAIPDIGNRVVDAKVEYDKSIRTPATNVEKIHRDYVTPKEKLIKLHKNNKDYRDHVLESAGLAQNITNSLYKLYSYSLSHKNLHIPV